MMHFVFWSEIHISQTHILYVLYRLNISELINMERNSKLESNTILKVFHEIIWQYISKT